MHIYSLKITVRALQFSFWWLLAKVPSESQAIVKEKDRQNYTGIPLWLEVQFSGNAPDLFWNYPYLLYRNLILFLSLWEGLFSESKSTTPVKCCKIIRNFEFIMDNSNTPQRPTWTDVSQGTLPVYSGGGGKGGILTLIIIYWSTGTIDDVNCINPLNPELNPICCLQALLGANHFLHVSRIKVKSLTLRVLMSYIYIYIYIYIWSTHSWCF